jgi:AraC-like DNA-binding protein
VSEIDLLRPAGVSAGTVSYPPGGTLGPRSQGDIQLVLVHEGSARIEVDGESRRIAAREVGLLLPGHLERFEFDPARDTRHSWVQAHVPGVAPELVRRLEALPATLPLSPALEELAAAAVAAGRGTAATPPLLAHLVSATLWRYVAEAERETPARAGVAEEARGYIHANLHHAGLTLAEVASAVHVTPAHLIRSFRRAHGVTPIAYLWERRTALGADLLANTGLPIGTIAERCGFATTHHLSRRVKQATGLPPGGLRRASWERE